MELIEIIVYSLQIFIIGTLAVIISAFLVYRIKKKKPENTSGA